MNASEGIQLLFDEAARAVPEVTGKTFIAGRGEVTIPNFGKARTINGILYKTLIRTSLPTAQFRNANEGIAPGTSTYENRLVECFILNSRHQVDTAVAKASEDGEDALMVEEGKAQLQANLMLLAKQFYYGRNTGGDAKGHPGLQDAVDSSMTYDATGSTANTGSSVYAVKFGEDHTQWVMGKDGQLAVTPVMQQLVNDPSDATKQLLVSFQEIMAWVGVQVKNKFAVGRIKNLTAQNGKTLTDDMLSQLYALFPIGYGPDAFLMTRRSWQQLQDSRTATSPTGNPAPFPTDFEGIPIIPTDNLLNTEAIT